ncbi:hypothetical protein OHV08_49395 [Streptomyces canus]|uniref:hypothetical protein n=1 Tax=Streptomyces canus TaxID=58343 RepID=UPI0032535E9A
MTAEPEEPTVWDEYDDIDEASDRHIFQPDDNTPPPEDLPTAGTGVAVPVAERPEEPQGEGSAISPS